MIFKTIIKDVNTLGVAIDKVSAVMKKQTTLNVMDYSLFGTAIDGLSAKQVALALSTQKLSQAQLEEIVLKNDLLAKYGAEELVKVGLLSANSSLLASEKAVNAEKLQEVILENALNKEKAEDFIQTQLEITADGEEIASTTVLNKALMDEMVKREILSKEKADEILQSFGVVSGDIAETASKSALTKATWELVKAQLAQIASNPITWILGAVGAVALLTKVYDALIGKQEKLARTKLEDLNEDITTYDEEIQSLEELQTKLESAKGNKSELAQIQNELNDAIGETAGLLNGEGKAYDIANAKLKANIELKKQQRQQAIKDKVSASKDLFDNNVYEADWNFDVTGNQMRTVTKQYQEYLKEWERLSKKDKEFWKKLDIESAEDYAFKAIKDKGIDLGGGTTRVFSFNKSDWTDYWNEQVQTAYDVFDEVIQDYDGVGGQDFIKNLIDNMVRSGSDLSEIGTIITKVTENPELQEAINSYWESLVDPEIDSEEALKSVKTMIDGIIKQYPQLESFFNNFYEGIVSGAKTVTDSLGDVETSISSISDALSGIQSLSDGLDQLDKIYADVKDGEYFDFSSILNNEKFTEAFGGLGESYENFIKTITNSPSDINACQQAFNDLATAYINNSKELDNVTDKTANATIEMLKQMGIANAEEVVTTALTKAKAKQSAEEAFLAEKKNNSAISSAKLTDATWQEVYAVWAEGTASETAKQYLAQLALTKFDVQNIKLDTRSDIDNIIALAKAAGTSTEYLSALQKALNALQSAQSKKSQLTSPANSLNVRVAAKSGNLLQEINKIQEQEDIIKQSKSEIESIMSSIQNVNLKASDFYAPITYGGGSTTNKGGSGGKDTQEQFDWIEIAISRLQRTITNLGKTVSATWKSWTDRNSALKSQISAVTQEINLQANAANKYLSLANSVGLGEGYKSLVRNGTLDISTITDENTINAIKQYQEFYENYLSALDAKQDAEDELANLKQTSFDNIITQYEDQLAFIEHDMSILESTADLLENKGYMKSASIYDKLIQQEDAKISSLEAKYKALTNELASNGIQQDTEQWNDMKLEILEVEEAILESRNALVEYNNTLQELDWEVFDKLQEKISSITEEANFLIELMSDEKMFDDGKITEHGQATLGLHALNYKTYMAQAEEFAKELSQIEEELANDPYNQTLLERKNELLESQRDSILAAEDEKQSIKDLVSEGYDNLLSTMDEIIDKRKEMLNQIQDMYEYEKNIAELTKEVATLEKQEIAFRGDDSESGKAKYQQIKVSLEEARQNLEETEREKTISDIEKMLDTLRDETEQFTSERLDNLDGLIADVIAQTETNTDSILKTLETETTEVGATITSEMEKIWGTNGTFTTSLNSVVDMFKQYFDNLQKEADEKAKETIASTPSGGSSGGSSTTVTHTPAPSTSSSSSSSSSSGWKSALVYSRYLGNKSALNTSTSIVDLLKSHDYSAAWNDRANLYRAMNGSGQYVGSSSQNRFMINTMKGAGFTKGGTIGNLIKATGEDGFVLARTGEGILTPENMKMLESVMITMNPIVDSLTKLPSLPDVQSRYSGDTQVTFGDIQMYGVNDPVEFEKQLLHHMKNSRPVRMVMKDTTIGEALGKNSMIRYTR